MSRWFRQVHRWSSIAFTLGVILYIVAMTMGEGEQPAAWMGLLALLPLIFLLLTGLYLFLLPYAVKWRNGRGSLASLLLLPSIALGFSAQQGTTDIIIVNGRIFTGVPSAPWAEALSIRGDRIVAVGTTDAIRAKGPAAARVIDAAGRLVIPGINDAHAHPSLRPAHVQLEGPPAFVHDPSWDEIVQRLKAAVPKAPARGWIMGEIGGKVLDDANATRFALDALTGDKPTVLISWHGHGTVFNTAALRLLKVSETEPDPPGGFFKRMPDGKTITGMAHEYAEYALRQRITMLPPAEAQIRGYQRFAAEAASFGITSVQAMMTGYAAAEALPLMKKGNLPVRMRVVDFPMESPATWKGAILGSVFNTEELAYVSGVKYIMDGTPIERLMFLRQPFSDAPNTRGRLNFSEAELRKPLTTWLSARVQPMFHVVGDAAIDTVLSALDGSGGAAWSSLRPRLEHADMLEPSHFDRAKRLGVVIVQNPAHFMLGPLMRARLGDRVARTAIVKSIVRAGIPFALGSDGPINPFLNIMFATVNEVNPAEALSVEEALVAYTQGSAYAQHMETRVGTLTAGKLADLAILSQDIFRIPPPDLPKTTSVMTIVGGRIVHDRSSVR